jgi:hypothetical protein
MEIHGVELPACRFCGLVSREGCRHTRANFQAPVLSVPIRQLGGVPSHLLGPEVPPVFSIPISLATGFPLRA